MKFNLFVIVAIFVSVVAFLACSNTASGEPIEFESLNGGGGTALRPQGSNETSDNSSSSNVAINSSSSYEQVDSIATLIEKYIKMVNINDSILKRSTVTYKVNDFFISATEITENLYSTIMKHLPEQDTLGDNYPVTFVNWYEAALFCNELSKIIGLDTAYVYKSIAGKNLLKDLSINYKVASIRLPTEIEWEIAARAGSYTTYYWGTAEASKYAYYGQSKGPTKVASFLPNANGIFDLGGNVAEWTNDWYDAFPTTSKENYTGALEGNRKVVRGGGWNDTVKAMALDARDKKDPLFSSQAVGFRVVYSAGF